MKKIKQQQQKKKNRKQNKTKTVPEISLKIDLFIFSCYVLHGE